MPPAAKKSASDAAITEVMAVTRGEAEVCILGTSPMICNRMSQKTLYTLLLGTEPINKAARNARAKHDPVQEFRDSPYLMGDNEPTAIGVLASAFKGALASAALDVPGASKTQIGRLVWVNGDYVPVFGIPKLFMSVVRSADMNRTPDVRTRAILPQWACHIQINFAVELIKLPAIQSLLSTAGLTQGIGDWRPQKGKGSYGQFRIVNSDDPEWRRVIEQGGREAQRKALHDAIPYDSDTEDLLSWFGGEVKRRGFDLASDLEEAA